MNKFSKRERTLIFIMLIVVIVIGSITFLIVPQKKKMDTLQSKYDTIKMEKQTIASELFSIPTYQSLIETSKEEIDKIKSELYPQMTNDEVEDIVSSMISANGLVDVNLSIADIEPEKTEEAVEDKETVDGEEAEEQVVEVAPEIVEKKSVYVKVNGDIANINSFFDDITKNKKISLLAFSTTKNNDNYSATIVLQFNMVSE